MPIRRPTAPAPLSPELATLLLRGPEAIGKTLRTIPPHDQLRALWRIHGPALEASLRRGQTVWFVERDWFVKQIRRER